MVIGGGLMAQAFQRYKDNDSVLMFASGVSSSKFCTVYDCAREEDLLREALDGCDSKILFVYFSSCSIASSNLTDDIYHTHKKKMENIIQMNAKRYTIFRLPNVVGSIVNLDTLFYYLVNKVKFQREFDLWSGAKRNIIDIDDVVNIVNNIIDNGFFANEIINVANLNDVTVDEIVNEISRYLGIDAKYSIIMHNDNYHIDTIKIEPIIKKLGLDFDSNYLKNMIKKYCNYL
jgi:nucleoside-diphosphate-sugar epimerase